MYLDLVRWKQDLHGARVDPRPAEASLLQDRSCIVSAAAPVYI